MSTFSSFRYTFFQINNIMARLRSDLRTHKPALRSDLQKKKDDTAGRISKSWNIDRKRRNKNSRGLANSRRYRCYQNALLQALLHLPIFLNWIRSHDCTYGRQNATKNPCPSGTFECVPCTLKKVIQQYWGPEDPAIPIEDRSGSSLGELENIAFANGIFQRGSYEDASQFMEHFLLSSCRQAAFP